METQTRLTRHGETRMSQRGIPHKDISVILMLGTDIGRDRIMLRKKDAERAIDEIKGKIRGMTNGSDIRNLKRQISTISRLTNKVLVVAGGRLITAYHYTSQPGLGTFRP